MDKVGNVQITHRVCHVVIRIGGGSTALMCFCLSCSLVAQTWQGLPPTSSYFLSTSFISWGLLFGGIGSILLGSGPFLIFVPLPFLLSKPRCQPTDKRRREPNTQPNQQGCATVIVGFICVDDNEDPKILSWVAHWLHKSRRTAHQRNTNRFLREDTG